MKKALFYIGKIAFSLATLPLWFCEIFVGVGHLPDEKTGEIVTVIFRHSMFENISDATHPALAYITIAIAVVSALVNVFAWRLHNNTAVKTVGNIAFGITMGLFLILAIVASAVGRGY